MLFVAKGFRYGVLTGKLKTIYAKGEVVERSQNSEIVGVDLASKKGQNL